MPDSFDAVRALYGEPRPDGTPSTPDTLSDTARAELAALAPVKAALEARVPQTPDVATLAAILDAARAAQAEHPKKAVTHAPRPRAGNRAAAKPVRRARSRVVMPVLALFACAAIGIALVMQQPDSPLADAVSPLEAAAPALAGNDTGVEQAEDAVAETRAFEQEVLQADEEIASAQPPVSTAAPTLAEASRVSETAPAARVAPAAAPSNVGAASDMGADEVARREVVSRSRVGVPAVRPGLSLAAAAPRAASSWEATTDEDLRLLSLRLQTLRESNEGLAWDEAPVALSVSATEALRARDLTSDTAHGETRVGFHTAPPPAGWIRVQSGGR